MSAQGRIAERQALFFPVNVPAGVSQADFRLSWREDWGNVPANDLDLLVINPNGEILTNFHVISGSQQVEVMLPDQSKYKATVLMRDRMNDLALIKIGRDATCVFP